ncbi:MAG: cation:proton antiporter [Clostridia bacterium]|nr:cation:proton antiporter [Clostridia bacterium]
MTTLLSLAIAMFMGLMMTRLGSKLKLPDVTAYLVAGVLVGPFFLGSLHIPGVGFQSYEELEGLKVISNVTLGFIAFSIGNEFRLSQLKATGKTATVVGIFQAVFTTALVDLVLIALHFMMPNVVSIPAAITLGAIAAATAPATTLMVVRQYKAKGELTELLLPIVAIDDAVGLVLFAISFGVAKAVGSSVLDINSILINPLIEIFASLALGAVAGWLLTELEKLFHSNTNRLILSISFVILTVALAMLEFEVGGVRIGFSSLLVCMMLGSAFCNLCPLSDDIMGRADRWSAPILELFFVVSGAELKFSVFAQGAAIVLGIVYVLSRSVGKYIGARESCKMTGCSQNVVNYLGITLFPQEGVALGMCVTASQLPNDGSLIRNIVLFAVLVYELSGPLLSKWALTKAGDIKPMGDDVRNRREEKLKAAIDKKKPAK